MAMARGHSARFTIRLLSTSSLSQPKLSTVHRGTAFEERSLKLLQECLSMSLRRVGGKSDGGVDLLGWWWLPDPSDLGSNNIRRRIRVLAQCKAEKKKTSPRYVRELEGVMHRYLASAMANPPAHGQLPPTDADAGPCSLQYPLIALLISESPFTKETLLRAQSSPVPLFLLHVPPLSDRTDSHNIEKEMTQLGAAVWNPALAGVQGVLRGHMEIRWERSLYGGGRPGLWWMNQKLKNWTPNTENDFPV